ncbi:MAG: hypothetical protein AAFN27_19150 [Pseudomonadota bacterium]
MPAISPIANAFPTPTFAAFQGAENPIGAGASAQRVDPAERSGAGASGTAGEDAAQARREAQDRSERNAQFSNIGARGTRGGETGLLSRGAGVDAAGGRESRAERAGARGGREAETQTVREAVPPRRKSVVERIMEIDPGAKLSEIVDRVEAGSADQSRVQTERFKSTLNEVRSASNVKETSPPAVDPAPADARPDDPVGRYDKTV